MPHRPWYRSLLFWLGLPGAPFIVWAWVQSMASGRGMQWVGTGRSFFLSHGASSLRFGTDDASRKAPLHGFNEWEWDLALIEPLAWFPPPALKRLPEYSEVVLLLPHWLGLGLYLAAWLGGLALWQARKRRTPGGSTGCPPSAEPAGE